MSGGTGPESGPSEPGRRIGPYEQSLRETARRAEILARERARSLRRRRWAVLATLVLVLAAVGYGGWRYVGGKPVSATAETSGTTPVSCSKPTPVSIAAAPAIAPALSQLAESLSSHQDAPCASYSVEPADPYAVAGAIGVPNAPDAWVTDSTAWLARASAVSGRTFKAAPAFASTGVVVALPRAQAQALGGRPTWSSVLKGPTPIRIPDPNRSAVGSAALGQAAQGMTPGDLQAAIAKSAPAPLPDLSGAASSQPPIGLVATAAQLAAHNESHPDHTLAAVAPVDGSVPITYSLVPLTTDGAVAPLVEDFSSYLTSSEARDLLRTVGFATPGGGSPQSPTPLYGIQTATARASDQALATVGAAWRAATPKVQALIALDVSGSMLERTTAGTRLEVVQNATAQAAAGMAPESRLALWSYSQHLSADHYDYKTLVDYGPVAQVPQLKGVVTALAGLTKVVGGGRGLYDTIAASYERALGVFAPGQANTVVIVTDGPNQDDYGTSEAQLKQKLTSLRDPARPVRIMVVGFGPAPDQKVLAEVAALTGGSYLPAPQPKDLLPALTRALGS